ncbi:hypothetical protein GCM10023194_55650 [Planotetraspora phitsanulokensis]|uniref:Signal transduction histidine kinase subgroup 3 dimerisation and phosphoacceptor domain-containing protein n=1 Tax=Planotetraspora phitsanulokensis TaxID=575192 RepID=A0A8J3UEI7_9ACTN|nr:histidine kinase [Planotetraspora phitsanulokensis]GII41836.1 hypothetical protein Pph01_68390 [Planotetraspora phitsanulokensis]
MPSSAVLALAAVTICLVCAALAGLACRSRRSRRPDGEALRRAAAEAREQLGRDVHDLVSSRLWLASLQGELAYRLADENSPVRPALANVIESVRRAATDIRNVTRSYQEISLWSEIADARAVLTARGVDCTLHVADVALAPEAGAVFAVTVREAVTNVLRHSDARRCLIEMRQTGRSVTLTVANDGVEPMTRPRSGTGIDSLRIRAAALDGTVSTILDLDGWFRLVTELPTRSTR